MAKPLSPAAQAVLDAFVYSACKSTYEMRDGLAAALRAAGEQVEAAPVCLSIQVPGIKVAAGRLRRLATELEGDRQGEQSPADETTTTEKS